MDARAGTFFNIRQVATVTAGHVEGVLVLRQK